MNSIKRDRIRKIYSLSPKITLCVEEVPSAYSTSVGLFCDVGSRHESSEFLGAAHLCEHMFFKRTSDKTAYQISKISERLGGELNAYTDRELTCFYADSPTEQFQEMLDLILEMLLDTQFTKKEFQGELDVVVQELLSFEDSPDDVFGDLSIEVPWKSHPLSLPVGATSHQVKKLNFDKIKTFIENYYLKSSWVISVCTPLKVSKVDSIVRKSLKKAESLSSGSALSKVSKIKRSGGSAKLPKELYLRSKAINYDTEQVQVALTFPGLSAVHPQQIIYTGLASMLGQGSSSWLYKEMREERGLVYHVSSSDLCFSDSGAFQIVWSCGLKYLDESVQVAADCVARLGSKIDPEEVKFVRESIQGASKMAFDGIHTRMEAMGRQQMLMGKVYGLSETLKELDKIQHKSLQKVAKNLVVKPSILLFGPVGKADLSKTQKLWRKTLCLK